MSIFIRNGNIKGQIQNLLIENDTIIYIGTDIKNADTVIDASGKYVLPGMIDPHVHVRDLGQSEKEDWTTASRAAVKGGITTVFDMPNNKPPTVNLNNLNLKRKAAEKALVSYKFNIGVTENNLNDVREMLKDNPTDISAMKLFLAGSSANEYVEDIDTVKRIFDLSLEYDLPVIIHTELQKCIEKYTSQINNPDIFDHHFIRHPECANRGTGLVVKLARETGNKIYIAHTSTAEEIEIIRQNKTANIFCEITPHHLLLNQSILQKAGNYAKVNPPIRTEKDNQALWQGILDGTVDCIGTDHAPHTLVEKNKPYPEAPSGFPGLETALPLLLNEVKKGNLTMRKLTEITSQNAARIFGLTDRGVLEVGKKADIIIVDMNRTDTVRASDFETKAKYSPYEGMEIVPVETTIVQGKIYNLK